MNRQELVVGLFFLLSVSAFCKSVHYGTCSGASPESFKLSDIIGNWFVLFHSRQLLFDDCLTQTFDFIDNRYALDYLKITERAVKNSKPVQRVIKAYPAFKERDGNITGLFRAPVFSGFSQLSLTYVDPTITLIHLDKNVGIFYMCQQRGMFYKGEHVWVISRELNPNNLDLETVGSYLESAGINIELEKVNHSTCGDGKASKFQSGLLMMPAYLDFGETDSSYLRYLSCIQRATTPRSLDICAVYWQNGVFN